MKKKKPIKKKLSPEQELTDFPFDTTISIVERLITGVELLTERVKELDTHSRVLKTLVRKKV